VKKRKEGTFVFLLLVCLANLVNMGCRSWHIVIIVIVVILGLWLLFKETVAAGIAHCVIISVIIANIALFVSALRRKDNLNARCDGSWNMMRIRKARTQCVSHSYTYSAIHTLAHHNITSLTLGGLENLVHSAQHLRVVDILLVLWRSKEASASHTQTSATSSCDSAAADALAWLSAT
jgi:uncharacterized membrane protein